MYKKLSGFSDEISSDVTMQFKVLNRLGIDFFEPRGIDGKNISELSEKEVLSLKQKMDAYGIKASSIGSPVGKIKLSEDFEPHFEMFCRVVKTAKVLDAKYIRIFSFYNEASVWSEQDRSEVLSRLQRLIDYAGDNGVILLHENEKDIYGDTIERCLDLMQTLSCKHFKAVFDPANFVQCGQDTKEAYETLKDYVAYIHIKDAKADGTVVPAGEGLGNISFILKSMFDADYDGYISLEPHLGTFEGLAALETSDEMLKLPKGGEGTFTLAHRALMNIINTL